jgi:hypothetical protein
LGSIERRSLLNLSSRSTLHIYAALSSSSTAFLSNDFGACFNSCSVRGRLQTRTTEYGIVSSLPASLHPRKPCDSLLMSDALCGPVGGRFDVLEQFPGPSKFYGVKRVHNLPKRG